MQLLDRPGISYFKKFEGIALFESTSSLQNFLSNVTEEIYCSSSIKQNIIKGHKYLGQTLFLAREQKHN